MPALATGKKILTFSWNKADIASQRLPRIQAYVNELLAFVNVDVLSMF